MGPMSSPTALVTGATGGIGLHIARQFAEQGWTVLVGARDAARGGEVAVQFGGRPLLLDVTDADSIATAAATVFDLDVLVNNAGISLDTRSAGHRDRRRGLPAHLRDERVRRGRSHQRVLACAASGACQAR
jgi:NADP-dependent 3-hydroxy acid dehydrogenase YdfG